MPRTTVYDTENQFSWAEKSQTTDDFTGEMLQDFVRYDTGVVMLDLYENGLLQSTLVEDVETDGGLSGWSSKSTQYRENGTLDGIGIVYDNGVYVSNRYDNNTIYSSFGSDPDNAEVWSRTFTQFDNYGQISVRGIEYDNQIHQITYFSDGQMTQRAKTDDGDIKSWAEISERFDQYGQRQMVIVQNDNGTGHITSFEDNVRRSIYETDELDVTNWETRSTEYDRNGQVAAKITEYDNGITRVDTFADGQRVKVEQYDTAPDGGVKSWDEITTDYDINGQVEQKLTKYDNGVVRVDTYAEGARTKVEKYDVAEDGGAGSQSWDRIETQYDVNGNVYENVTFYDDGTVRVDRYVDGVRTGLEQYDVGRDGGAGDKVWDRIENAYDAVGNLTEKVTFYDNGIVKVQAYEGGALVGIENYDIEDAASWDSIQTTFSTNGDSQVRETATIFDDGVARVDMRNTGEGRMVYEQDASEDGNARSWDTNDRFYDASNTLIHQNIRYDSGDVFIFEHTDGARDRKLESDGDDSHDWAFRVTDYTAEGPVVTTYDTAADTPTDVLDSFDYIPDGF